MNVRRRLRHPTMLVGLVALLGLAACGAPGIQPDPTVSVPATVGGVGQLPDPLSGGDGDTDQEPVDEATTVPPVDRTVAFAPLGQRASGNRLLVIGDSITASTARRHGGEMCFALLPLGWAVEVNAEVSRFVDFGHRVLDRRLRPDEGADWDAAVVFLGTNYGGDAARYREELEGILDRLAPRPTVLVTVTEFRPDRAQVNSVIRELAAEHEQVEVLEWAEISRADRSVLAPDGIHLSADGRARLVVELSELLGPAPDLPGPTGAEEGTGTEETDEAQGSEEERLDESRRPRGECLPTSFTDDSAGRPPGAAPPPVTLVGGGRPVGTTPATTAGGGTTSTSSTSTTSPPGPSPTPAPGTGSGGGSGTTAPATTAPVTTDVPPAGGGADGDDGSPSTTPGTTSGDAPSTSAPDTSPETTVAPTTAAPTTAAPTTAAPTTPAPTTAAPTTAAPTTAAPAPDGGDAP